MNALLAYRTHSQCRNDDFPTYRSVSIQTRQSSRLKDKAKGGKTPNWKKTRNKNKKKLKKVGAGCLWFEMLNVNINRLKFTTESCTYVLLFFIIYNLLNTRPWRLWYGNNWNVYLYWRPHSRRYRFSSLFFFIFCSAVEAWLILMSSLLLFYNLPEANHANA